MNSWFIEDPLTKDLVKSLSFTMPAETEKEFIIVMKAPLDKPQFNLATFLILKLASQDRVRDYHIEKHLTSALDLEDIEIETSISKNQDVT